MLIFTTDKNRLLKHFQRDPVLFAYHIGDLGDFYFPDCLWPAVFGRRGGIENVLLTYFGCDNPTVLAFGLNDGFDDLLREYLPIAPKKFFCHFQPQHRAIFVKFARENSLGTHVKMKLDEAAFQRADKPDREQPDAIVRLDSGHEPALRKLYAVAYPENYFVPRMLQTGKYFGYVHNDSLLAVAGVHVVSDPQRIAVLGNITTHPDSRGRGLATLLTYRLVKELVDEGKTVCLNVKADNTAAIACYAKLGFLPVHEYEEALLELK